PRHGPCSRDICEGVARKDRAGKSCLTCWTASKNLRKILDTTPKDKFPWKNFDACSIASAFLLPGNSLPADYAKSHNFRF
ncbi:hypothetical protein, partial [uncultured Desulfovibrio sp.]|uniref:hypothetical protein n=1 Tax=uncultured Desulfovibrio sp. TaxID=167968 RepID=UPI0026281616